MSGGISEKRLSELQSLTLLRIYFASVIENIISKMSSTGGANALMALKSKMQGLREELDKANDQLEAKNREFEAERESRTQVTRCYKIV